MVHIANGLYKYSFANYDDSIDYVFMADGGISLSSAPEGRFQFGNNEIGQVTNQSDSISAALNSELAIIAGLVQRNQRIVIKQFELTAVYNLSNQLEDYLVKEL